MKHRGANTFLSMDWLTVLLYTILVFMGWINIYSAVYDESHSSILSVSQRYGKQLIWIGVAYLGIIVPIMASSNKIYSVLAYIIYGTVMVMLALVLVAGKESHGAKSWFELGMFKIQPSEFAKFATALALSKLMSAYDFALDNLKNWVQALGLILLPAALILLQPDMGSVIVYFSLIFVFYREGMPGIILVMVAIGIVMFVYTLQVELYYVMGGLILTCFIGYLLYGGKLKHASIALGIIVGIFLLLFVINYFLLHSKFEIHILILAATVLAMPVFLIFSYMKKSITAALITIFLVGCLGAVLSVDFVFHNMMTAHQQTLINVFLGLENDPKGTGYNVEQSKIAIGSGGFSGKGFLQGTQTKYNFVPEQATDFIFCTVGEEWGFVGTTVVIILFLSLILRLIYLAEKQRSAFARIYGYCVASILFFHLAINVGMTIGMVPVIGIPLPFFSYGGSSLWSFTILLFIFIRLDASRDEML